MSWDTPVNSQDKERHDGHSSRPCIAARLQRPTRELWRAEPARRPRRAILPYLVLLRVGFSLPPPLPAARCALTAPFHPYSAQPPQRTHSALSGALLRLLGWSDGAVCFLWHFPSTALKGRCPDVIRHTALWSSDFPLPAGATKPPARGGLPKQYGSCSQAGSDRPAQQLTT